MMFSILQKQEIKSYNYYCAEDVDALEIIAHIYAVQNMRENPMVMREI